MVFLSKTSSATRIKTDLGKGESITHHVNRREGLRSNHSKANCFLRKATKNTSCAERGDAVGPLEGRWPVVRPFSAAAAVWNGGSDGACIHGLSGSGPRSCRRRERHERGWPIRAEMAKVALLSELIDSEAPGPPRSHAAIKMTIDGTS
jgi:hypothetical protein